MPTLENMLIEQTFKGVYLDISERTFRTLNDIDSLEPKRTSKLLSELVKNLHQLEPITAHCLHALFPSIAYL